MCTVTLIGNGNMALAIAEGLKKKNYTIEVIGRNRDRLDAFEKTLGITIAKTTLDRATIEGKTVILCVKPANLHDVATRLQGKAHLLVSVLAGTTLDTLKEAIIADGYVRAMPNLAALYQKSMTTLTGDELYKEKALDLLSAIGRTRWLGSEKELDIATALSGSGPAYLAIVAEALADGAVALGLKRDDAKVLTEGLFEGSWALLQHMSPTVLKESVMSPGGTTAAGCKALEAHAVRASFFSALQAAYEKAQLLGEKHDQGR